MALIGAHRARVRPVPTTPKEINRGHGPCPSSVCPPGRARGWPGIHTTCKQRQAGGRTCALRRLVRQPFHLALPGCGPEPSGSRVPRPGEHPQIQRIRARAKASQSLVGDSRRRLRRDCLSSQWSLVRLSTRTCPGRRPVGRKPRRPATPVQTAWSPGRTRRLLRGCRHAK
jgi:hypothetical protein